MHIEPRTQSLRTVLDGLIDYAGLFPPASLDLETSAKNFVRYLRGADRWMLRSFVCPGARLNELATLVRELRPNMPVSVTALGPAPGDGSWEKDLETTIEVADRFDQAMQEFDASVDSFELKLQANGGSNHPDAGRFFDQVATRARSRRRTDYFVEFTPALEEPESAAAIVSALRDRSPDTQIGLKIRTGGVTPASVPGARAVARFVCACRDQNVPFKATAGLHHPLYHFSAEVGTEMHGFLNLFCGTVVAAVHGLDEESLAELLVDDDQSNLSWSDAGLTFGAYHVSTEEIRHVRETLVISFGSCSFDEPREDLLALGLATPTT